MKIRKFTAPDMSRALKMVRDELGPDAVILSNRKDGQQIELIAASEYDPVLYEASRKEVEALVSKPVSEPADPSTRKPLPLQDPFPAQAGVESATTKTDSEYQPQKRTSDQPARNRPSVVVEVRKEADHTEQLLNQRAAQEHYSEIQRELHAMRALLDQQLQEWSRERLRLQEPARAQWVERLLQAGFDEALARSVTRKVDTQKNEKSGWHDVLVRLSQQLPVELRELQPGMQICFIGPAGAGKTTSLIKLAARFVMQHGASRLRLATLDHQRLGAQAQMESLAAILGVPLHGISRLEELDGSQSDQVLTLVDTPAMPTRSSHWQDFVDWLGFQPGWEHWLVLPATLQGSVLQQWLDKAALLQSDCMVLTQLDATARLGEALSVLMQQAIPLAWASAGPQIPEDLERARAARLIVRAMESLSTGNVHQPVQTLYTEARKA